MGKNINIIAHFKRDIIYDNNTNSYIPVPKIQFKKKNLYKCCLETQLYAVQKTLTNIKHIKDPNRILQILSQIPQAYNYLPNSLKNNKEIQLFYKLNQ